ncbi:hypothetical protein BGX26_004956 [Mortierella sp. AD094]|nr:hypothetical protein BGX26_004956 [Mortierella sp. AD094]
MKISLLFAASLVLAQMGDNVVLAQEPEHFASAKWLSSQLSKRDDSSTELRYTIDGSNSTPGSDGRSAQKPTTPAYQGAIVFNGPASRVYDLGHNSSPWTIVGCNASPDLIHGQTVLAYCHSNSPQADCADLFIGGARNTLVTLPATCGAPFGRIVKFDPTTTSQLPKSELAKLGSGAKDVSVFVMQFDFEFQDIPHKAGDPEIGITIDLITGSSSTTKSSDINLQHPDGRWSANHDQYLSTTKEFTHKLADINEKCKDFNLSLKASVGGKFEGSVAYGYHLSGTLWWVNEHRFYLKSQSSITASLSMSGLIKYEFPELNVPAIPETGLPGFSVPGILNVGPYVKADLKFSGEISVDGSLDVSTSVSLPSVDFSIGDDKPQPAAVKGVEGGAVKVTEHIDLSATLKMSVVPELGLGVKVLKLVDAKVAVVPYFGLDARGKVELNSEPKANEKTAIDACVDLNGHLALGYGVSGKIGPWGKDKKGDFWTYDKLLYRKCFNTPPAPAPVPVPVPAPATGTTGGVSKRGLSEDWHGDETLWKRASPSTKLVCPSKRPF